MRMPCSHARTQGEGLEQVALAGAVVAGDQEIVVAAHEVEASELEHEGLIEAGLELPVERLEGLALDEPAGGDAAGDALLELVRGFGAEDVLEERGRAGALAGGPREPLVERVERVGQSEEGEVSSEPGEDRVVVRGASRSVSRFGSGSAASLGHAGVSCAPAREVSGRRSYWVRSRGAVRV
jgi:hypothetical protein